MRECSKRCVKLCKRDRRGCARLIKPQYSLEFAAPNFYGPRGGVAWVTFRNQLAALTHSDFNGPDADAAMRCDTVRASKRWELG